MNTTTRRFSRTLADAFPDVRACAFEGPDRRDWRDRLSLWACALALVAWVVIEVLA